MYNIVDFVYFFAYKFYKPDQNVVRKNSYGETSFKVLLQIYREEIMFVFMKYLKYDIATNLSSSFVAGSTWSYLAVTTAGVVFPLVVNLQPFYITLILFIPIMGRSGTDVIPDVPIALFVILMMLISCQYCVSSLPVIIWSIDTMAAFHWLERSRSILVL